MESDALLVGADNNTSTCMAIKIHHFIGTLKPIKNRLVKGYGVVVKVREEVMVKYKMKNNDGQIHFIIVHKVNYVPGSPI